MYPLHFNKMAAEKMQELERLKMELLNLAKGHAAPQVRIACLDLLDPCGQALLPRHSHDVRCLTYVDFART